MADTERLLIAKAVQTGRIEQLLAQGIRSDHFADTEIGEIYTFLSDHARKYKQPPSFSTVREHFPLHNFELVDESVDYLTDEFLKGVKYRAAVDAIRDLAAACDDSSNWADMDVLFMEKSRELAQVVPMAKLHRFSDIEERIAAYEKGEGYQRGISMGIPAVDNITGGIQPHEYVTISGWSGTGKSTLSQWILFNTWMQHKKGMYISLEMEATALFRKWDTMLTHFKYNNLKKGELTDEELETWRSKAKVVQEKGKLGGDIIVMDDVRGCTVDRVYAEIVRWQPDILCLDYISLMDYRGGSRRAQMWEKITELTRELKQVARTTKCPIIGVAQTNRDSASGGASLDNIAYSVSIVQDSDIVLGLHQEEDMKKEQRMSLKMLKNRDGETTSTDLLWDMSTMTFGPWKESMLFRNRVGDAEEVTS